MKWTDALRLSPYVKRRQFPRVVPWPWWLAVSIVRELEERRSWRAALQASRTSTGRPLSSD